MYEIIEVKNLYKTYFNGVDVTVLKGIELAVEKGEFVAITGTSGSGKSTLLNMIGCLDKPTSGEVHIDKVDVTTLNEVKLAQLRNEKIGFIFQYHNLMPEFSALENVMIPMRMLPRKHRRSKHEMQKKATKLLDCVGLSHRLKHRPASLSGGEAQRVAIARALANSPAIVIGDEPTGNLDSATTENVFSLMKQLNKEREQTFVMVTHDERLAKRADRTVKLVDGVFENGE